METQQPNQNLLSDSAGELTEKLKEKYGIEQAEIYKRLGKLKIKSHKENGKVWLDDEQLSKLDNLHQWIQEKGSAKDYQFPEESGLAVAEQKGIATSDSEVMDADYAEGSPSADPFAMIRVAAQHMAAGEIMATKLMAADYRDNPDRLPDELQERIKQVERMTVPKPIDPMKYAQELIAKVRQQQTAA